MGINRAVIEFGNHIFSTTFDLLRRKENMKYFLVLALFAAVALSAPNNARRMPAKAHKEMVRKMMAQKAMKANKAEARYDDYYGDYYGDYNGTNYYGDYNWGDWYDYYGNYSDYYGDYNGDYAAWGWGAGRKMPVKKMMKAKKVEARNEDYYGDYYGTDYYGDWYDYYGNYSDYYGDWYDYYGNYSDYYGDWSDYYGDYYGDYMAAGRKMARRMSVKKAHPNK